MAVEGVNTSGRKMVASNIHEGVPHAPMKSTVRDLLQFHHSDAFQGGSPLQIVTAAGPFTCSDNLDYQPLMDFLTNMVVQKPDVIILTGPFVDIRHKTIAAGLTTMETGSYDDDGGTTEILVPMEIFFANKIARALEIFFEADESLQTQFVVIPSLDDATAEWVYPQPPFTDRRPGGGKALNVPGFDADFTIGTLGFEGVETVGRGESKSRRVHCLSNPCTFKINEVVIGVTATDVLCHLSAEESNGNLEANSRMGHIAEHLLQQRSYYPLFPGSCEANLDLKHMNQWTIPCGLDVLILPSKLGAFCRPVLQNKTIVINSGQLTKSTTGGTYAELTLYPLPRKTLDEAGGDSVEFFHDIHERAAVQIQRI